MFNFHIDNFRSFSNAKFEFDRVNILIGENSSGKSSLLKFFQLLGRSYRDYFKNFNFTSEIGSYSDFVHEQDDKKIISFEFCFGENYKHYFISQNDDDDNYSDFISKILDSTDDSRTKLRYSFGKEVNSKNNIRTEIANPKIGGLTIWREASDKDDLLAVDTCSLNFINSEGKTFIMRNISYDKQGFLTIVHGSSLSDNIQKNFTDDQDIFYNIAFLLITQNFLRFSLNRFRYINPIDSVPLRSYGEIEGQGLYPVKDIKDVVNILTDESLGKRERSLLKDKLNKVLRELGILNELKILSRGYETKIVKVRLTEDGIWSNIKDVGYGTSLQIPILFQAIIGEYAGGEIIMIEQPEIHIHPKLQSKFIEVLLSIGSKNTYIIETHSEDIVRKLQVMIKKQQSDLTSKSVNIYYFERSKNNTCVVNQHKININGKLEPNFPSGFYDTSANLVKELF